MGGRIQYVLTTENTESTEREKDGERKERVCKQRIVIAGGVGSDSSSFDPMGELFYVEID